MEFTGRFLELPIKVYSKRQQDLTGKADFFDGTTKVLATEISNYKKCSDEDLDIDEIVHITLKNGEAFNVYMTLVEFEDTLNAHAAYNAL